MFVLSYSSEIFLSVDFLCFLDTWKSIRRVTLLLMNCSVGYGTRFAPGGVQLPSRIDGGVVVGQYKRMTRTNFPLGAGNQMASFALPGDSACRYMSTGPPLLVMNLLRWLNS